jgi:hypothetical protein
MQRHCGSMERCVGADVRVVQVECRPSTATYLELIGITLRREELVMLPTKTQHCNFQRIGSRKDKIALAPRGQQIGLLTQIIDCLGLGTQRLGQCVFGQCRNRRQAF